MVLTVSSGGATLGTMARSIRTATAPRAASAPADEQDLRARILRASVTLIDEQGLGSLSMREVARRAGVSHQAPYHHFEDRAAILAAICEEGFGELQRRMHAAQSPVPKDVAELLERCGVAYVTFALAYPAHFRIMFRPELVEMEKFPAAHCKAEDAFAELVKIVQKYVEHGRGWNGKEQALISLCWSVSHGLASLLLDGPLRAKQPEAAAQLDHHVRDVMRAFRVMVDAGLARGSEAG
jgi:AcrR family transcriptional regulator